MQKVRENIRVAVIFGPGDSIRPVWFDWRRRKYEVREVTYSWQEREGAATLLHFAVSDGANLFELTWNSTGGAWSLAAVDVIDIDTVHPERVTREAGMIIAATGTPGLVTDAWVREGATVIDYGFAKKGVAYFGDVDFDSVHTKAGLLTPVPGGMGPLVVAAVCGKCHTAGESGAPRALTWCCWM